MFLAHRVVHSFIYSLWGAYYVPGSVLEMKGTDKEQTFQGKESEDEQIGWQDISQWWVRRKEFKLKDREWSGG